jgi:hypothetical protein
VTLAELEQAYPWITWREPISVVLPEKAGMACRVCIAQAGIKSADVDRLFDTSADFAAHLREAHL